MAKKIKGNKKQKEKSNIRKMKFRKDLWHMNHYPFLTIPELLIAHGITAQRDFISWDEDKVDFKKGHRAKEFAYLFSKKTGNCLVTFFLTHTI